MTDLVQVEKQFDRFAQQIGFSRVSDDVGSSPRFSNADYVDKKRRIVIELKILDTEYFPRGGIIDSMQAIIVQPININEDGTGQYEFSLPGLNREGKHDNFEEPLRRILKKANKQIRETKEYYIHSSEDLGFLIIAQLGLQSLSPEVTVNLIQKLLTSEFSSIDGVLVCTPNGSLVDPTTMRRNPEGVSIGRLDKHNARETINVIGELWADYYSLGGHTV